MQKLVLSFQDGSTAEIAFGAGSTLSVQTPDGVNGSIYGAWSEIVDVRLADGEDTAAVEPQVEAEAEVEASEPEPVEEPAPSTEATEEPSVEKPKAARSRREAS